MIIESETLYFGIKKTIQSLKFIDQHFQVRTKEGNFSLMANSKDFWPLIETAKHKDDFMYIWNTYLKKDAKIF